ncbi:MAG: membrane protease YdiL (CAAX protease family) [Paracoccaceae bacterium]|jgi:membrane protease YdiL (CAAX protease family)
MSYDPHKGFIQPAFARAQTWRLAAVVIMCIVGGIALFELAFTFVPSGLSQDKGVGATLFSLLSFGFFAVALLMAVRIVHARGLRSLIGPLPVAFRDFARVCLFVGALHVVLAIVLPSSFDITRSSLSFAQWLGILPLTLIGLLVQTGTEEVIFRGYLQQQLAARWSHPVVWMGGPATAFGLLHWMPEMGPNGIYFVLWAILFGVFTADLTARTGTLGAAIGLHMMQNTFAIAIVSAQGPGDALALYLAPFDFEAQHLPLLIAVEGVVLCIAWLAARVAVRA